MSVQELPQPALKPDSRRGLRIFRWIARGYGTLLGGFVLLFMLAELVASLLGVEETQPGGEPTAAATTAEIISLIGLAIAGIGLLIGWWRSGLAAAVAFAGALICIIAVPRSAPVIVPFLFGILAYLFVWLMERDTAEQRARDSS